MMNYKIGLITHKQKYEGSSYTLCGAKIPSRYPVYNSFHKLYLIGKTDCSVSCSDCCDLMPNRTYYLVMTNCDCAAFHKIMTYHPSRNKVGIKCPCCGKVLGPMQYGPIQTIQAASYEMAYAIFNGR